MYRRSLNRPVRQFLDFFPAKIADYEALLKNNPIWVKRTKDVGVISAEDAVAWGMTGPSLRGSGVDWGHSQGATLT